MSKKAKKNGGGGPAATRTKRAKKSKRARTEAAAGVRIPRQGVVKTSGSGFHEPGRYGKAERREARAEIERDPG